jgi:undecaprenyl-diphosphatase
MAADLIFNFRAFLKKGKEEPSYRHIIRTNYRKFVVLIIVSTIPTAIIGFAGEKLIRDASGTLIVPGICLLITAVLLALSEWLQKKRQGTGHEVGYKDAIIIGIAQACAVLPGLSRSGSTIATGLLCGVKKESVAQFSFLMVLIPILGEALLDLVDIIQGETSTGLELLPAIVGFVAAFVTGCFACRFMIEIVRRQRLTWFAVYCAIVGSVAIITTLC